MGTLGHGPLTIGHWWMKDYEQSQPLMDAEEGEKGEMEI
jgi:hypothetical protein